MERKEKANIVKAAVASYYKKKRRAVNYELGLCKGGRYRADVLAIAMNGHTVIVEVKSSVADYKADTKWRSYEAFCNQLYFAFPRSVWAKLKDVVPKDVGVFVISPKKDVLNRVTYRAKVVRKARNRDMDPDTRFNIMVRCVFRGADVARGKSAKQGLKESHADA